jgi:hypothetical protein
MVAELIVSINNPRGAQDGFVSLEVRIADQTIGKAISLVEEEMCAWRNLCLSDQ